MIVETLDRIANVVFKQQESYKVPAAGIYTVTPKGIRVEDRDLVKFTLDHMNWFDKLNPSKVIVASLYVFDMILGDVRTPTGNWKFKFLK